MDDPGKFLNIMEYKIAYCAIAFLVLSEFAIWIYTVSGRSRGKANGGRHRKGSDSGTVWLIILGWWFCIMAGAFFRSYSVPEFMRNWILPHFCYSIGILFIILGVIIRCTAVLTLGHSFTHQVQTVKDQHLMKTGLYHFVRNPAYSGSIMSLFGTALAYRSILGAISVIIVCLFCYGIRIHIEEKALTEHFQNEFKQYCQEVKFRLIPGIY